MDRNTDNNKAPKVAIAGCICVDICPEFISAAEDFGQLIYPGKITRIKGNRFYPGGSVANTGIAMKIFGTDVRLLARVGKDGMGGILMDMLEEKAGKDALESLAVSSDSDTAYSLILAPDGLDRAILQNPGANDDFCIDDIDWDALKGCRLMHFGHPPTLRHFHEDCGEQLVELFRRAREMDMVTTLDLCAVDPASDAGQADWKKILERVLPLIDFFLPSRDELAYMLLGEDYESMDIDSNDLIERSLSMGARNVLIKEGDQGMTYCNGEDFSDIEAKLGFEPGSMDDWKSAKGHLDAIPVEKEVSGLGAGDTSIGAYLAALLRGYSFENTLYLSRMEGALCVSHASSTEALLPFEEIIDLSK